jgi:hypothetical protein
MTKPTFEVHPDVLRLERYLGDRDRASYNEMSGEVGRMIRGRDRHILYAATRRLLRDRGIVFVTERNWGVVRATNGQVARLGTDAVIRKTGRAVRRSKKLHPLVNTQDLSDYERDAFWIGKAVVQGLDVMVGRKMRSKIAEEIREQREETDIKDLVALFSRPRRK